MNRTAEFLVALAASPTGNKLKAREALAVAVEVTAPDLLAADGSIDAADLRAILAEIQPVRDS